MGSVDERNRSLWVGTSSEGEYAALAGDATVDVVVLGAGITGLTTARLLVAEGRSVAVVEAGPVCAGATGYTTAKVTSLHSLIYAHIEKAFDTDAAAVYAAANEAGVAKIAELVAADDIDCDLQSASAYTYTQDPKRVADIEAEVEAAQRAGLHATFANETDLPYGVLAAIRLDGQYQFHPRRYCLGLAEAITKQGGRVFAQTRALRVDEGGSTVTTDRGVVHATDIVIATHQPFPEAGAYFARLEPLRSYAIAVRIDDDVPEGMYISADEPSRSVRSTADGYVIVGGEGHKVGNDDNTEERYDALESWAREHFTVKSLDYRWSAQDYKTPDRVPYVGRMTPGSEHVYVATGYGKWGMSNGTAAALMLSDAIAGRENIWSDTFDSNRLAVRQSMKGLVTANLDVAKHFIGDRIAALSPRAADELLPGEGAVVDLDGDKVAAFRDDDGVLRALSAVCTHLGCQVSFNNAERTWDCPCHGSRFDVSGAVLEGPATKDLGRKPA